MKLDPARAKQILKQIEDRNYRMNCWESDQGRNKHRCGFAREGSTEFNIVFNERFDKGCKGYEETIFHEILHLGKLRNQDTHFHNNGSCSKYDAVYYCTRACFKDSPREPIEFTPDACNDCVKNSREKYRCHPSRFQIPTFDDSYHECGQDKR